MVIMDIRIDNFYAFKNFHMNMSYPKKIVGSMIEEEYLVDRPNFRYKKVNVIMGANATGKTSLGRILMLFMNYMSDGGKERFLQCIAEETKKGTLQIDFVADEPVLYRFILEYEPQDQEILIYIQANDIGMKDNYENCAKKFEETGGREVSYKEINSHGWHFSYPQDACKTKIYRAIEDDARYILILKRILKALDPGIQDVVKVQEVENTYVVKWENASALIKDGKIAEGNALSSGTKAGLDISYIIASMVCGYHDLYYCDELFSYVNTDIEKVCLSLIIDKLEDRKQIFFTTHNTDILDMQLPKHAFTFLKKDIQCQEQPIQCINAAQYLKRNTDSLKNAVENDLFCTAPNLDQLYEIGCIKVPRD